MKKCVLVFLLIMAIDTKASNISTIVMDNNTNRILYENNAYEKRLIASTTKIMTFIVAYEYGHNFLDVHIEAGEEVLKMYGTSIYLNYKEQMSLRDLLYGLMLRSGNDASVVIANFIAGSEENFVELMNKKAKKLGMDNTVFNNPHGLDEITKNYSTAYDMALLSSYANQNEFYRQVTSTKYYKTKTEAKAYSWTNRNKLLFTYPYLISGKTGYTPKAGKTYVSSASKDNFEVTIVTLNDDKTYENHKMLYEEVFNNYKNHVIVNKNKFYLDKKIIDCDAYIKKNIVYPVTNNEIKDISTKIIIDENSHNNIVGYVRVYLKDKEVLSENIYLQDEEIEKKTSILQKIKKIFKKILSFFS